MTGFEFTCVWDSMANELYYVELESDSIRKHDGSLFPGYVSLSTLMYINYFHHIIQV